MDTWLVVYILIAVLGLWLYTAFLSRSFPTLMGKRILLLIAHPDDEAMFFAPTVQSLSRKGLGNQFKILCLSTGNADGLGEIRKQELRKSATILGLDRDQDVWIMDDPVNLQDGQDWKAQHIARSLITLLAPSLARTPSNKAPTASIDVIITFDQHGVSSHGNHKSCYRGAEIFLAELMKDHSGWEPPVAIYALRSVNILRKYSHAIDAALTMPIALGRLALMGGGKSRKRIRDSRGKEEEGPPNPKLLFCVNNPLEWNRAQRAMVSGHWSQMVWFRWGWIGLGRYLILNDFRQVKHV